MGSLFPFPGELPDPGIELGSPALQVDSLPADDDDFVAKLFPTLATPWTVACQAPLSVVFSRQEYWSGLPFPPPGDLPDPGIEPGDILMVNQ